MTSYLWRLQVFWRSLYVKEKTSNLIKFNDDQYKYHAIERYYVGRYKRKNSSAGKTTGKCGYATIWKMWQKKENMILGLLLWILTALSDTFSCCLSLGKASARSSDLGTFLLRENRKEQQSDKRFKSMWGKLFVLDWKLDLYSLERKTVQRSW